MEQDQGGGVAAGRDERSGAEGHLAAVTGENVPRLGDRQIGEQSDAEVQLSEAESGSEGEGGDREQCENGRGPQALWHRPRLHPVAAFRNRPWGRTARTRKKAR